MRSGTRSPPNRISVVVYSVRISRAAFSSRRGAKRRRQMFWWRITTSFSPTWRCGGRRKTGTTPQCCLRMHASSSTKDITWKTLPRPLGAILSPHEGCTASLAGSNGAGKGCSQRSAAPRRQSRPDRAREPGSRESRLAPALRACAREGRYASSAGRCIARRRIARVLRSTGDFDTHPIWDLGLDAALTTSRARSNC